MVDYTKHKALEPFFKVIENAIRDEVDGDRFYEMLDENIQMEFRFAVPGTPAELRGRQAVIDSFSGYGDILDLEGMECENAYRTDKPGVIILQYKGNGVGVATGRPYNQSYISILTIADRKVIHWNDYWNPLVVMEAIGGSDALNLAMYSN